MNAKQLELFTDSDFEQQKTYFRTLNGWFIVDKINKFGLGRLSHYQMAIERVGGLIYNEKSDQTTPFYHDQNAKRISVSDYFELSYLIRKNGEYVFNKKLGKLISKKG